MFKKQVASLLICTVMLLTVVSSNAFAQIPVPPKASVEERNLNDIYLKPKIVLNTHFSRAMSKPEIASLTATDIKRFENERMNLQAPPQPKSGLTSGEKKGLILFIVGMAAIVAFVIVKHCKSTDPNCSYVDPYTPSDF